MSGRNENSLKREKWINKKLAQMPEFFTAWNNAMLASELTSATRKEYMSKMFRFCAYVTENVKDLKPEDLTKLKVDTYLASLSNISDSKGNARHSSDSYKQGVWYCLNNFFTFLVEYGYIKSNPINIKKKPKNNDLAKVQLRRQLLTEREFMLIINSVKTGAGSVKAKGRQKRWVDRDLTIIYLFMSTGMRETALSEIDLSDIDYANNNLTVVDKGDKMHEYYINTKTMDSLLRWLKFRANFVEQKNIDTDALFITYQGNRITAKSLSNLVKKYTLDAVGKELSPHKLRAGFCSIMYNKTNDIEEVRRMVGHSNISTTQRYIVTDNSERKKASEIMDEFF